MIFNMNGGGHGGAALNFKVVGGTSAPSNPAENTIWVNTDIPIINWFFGRDDTDVSPDDTFAEGTVWITTSTRSKVEFNALKKNGICVCPVRAWQLVNWEWVEKEAKTYQGGAWVEWIPDGALFWHGDQCTDVTGGWGINKSATSSKAAPTCVFESDRIHLTNSGFASSGILSTVQKIDLTNAKVLSVDVTKLGSCEPILYVGDSRTDWSNNRLASVTCSATGIIGLDVSSVTGSHYVGFYIYADASALDFSVNEVYME